MIEIAVSGSKVMKATLDQGGRIELPAVVQAELGVKPGDELSFEPLAGAWVIRLVAKAGNSNNSAAADDDLNWPELEYESLAPRRVGEVSPSARPSFTRSET